MRQIGDLDLSFFQLYTYNGVLLLVFIYLVAFRYVHRQAYCYLTCLFFYGVVYDFSNLLAGGRILVNLYQVVMLIWGGMMVLKTQYLKHLQTLRGVFLPFMLYSLYYFYCTFIIHDDSILLVLAQYTKLLIPILFLFVMKELVSCGEFKGLFWVFWELVVLQIFFSIFKAVLIGGFMEGWVGSLTGVDGGGPGTTLPLLGLFLFALKTDFKNHTLQDVLYLAGLLLVGLLAGKRAVWLLFPILYLLLGIYVYKRDIASKFVTIVIVVPILFYIALRVSPSLNPEHKLGGSFDPDYALSYSLKYSAGIDDNHNQVQTGVGRVGAVTWMWQRILKPTKESLIGSGLEYMVYASHDNYSNQSYYQGINGRGSITGVVSMFMTTGLIGVILFLVFIISVFRQNKSRFALVVLLLALFDFIFYNATILTISSLLTLALFLNHFSEVEICESSADDKEVLNQMT